MANSWEAEFEMRRQKEEKEALVENYFEFNISQVNCKIILC